MATNNKQLAVLQHSFTLLKEGGRCAIVLPDNVLFEAGAGEVVRRALLEHCNVHTLLRLPTGIFYAQGVKANVLFFDASNLRRKSDRRLWIYDLRTDMHFTLKTRPLKQADLAEFVTCYKERHQSAATWDERRNPMGRWRSFEVTELLERERANLDIFWLEGRQERNGKPNASTDEIAQEIVRELQGALDKFQSIRSRLSQID